MTIKIVVIGDINGRFAEVFAKLSGLHAKQSFAFAIIVGSLFAHADDQTDTVHDELSKLIRGDIHIALPTYFALGKSALPAAAIDKLTADSGELCPNLTVLGRKVSIKTSEGLKIVAIGGAHVDALAEPADTFTAEYTDGDVESAKNFSEAHFLMTSDWPAGIRDKSQKQYKGEAPTEVKSVSDLCSTLKPRYHFSTSESFYEREPFFHAGPPSDRAFTRFISLAPYGNASKQKWIYAFTFDTEATPAIAGATASPFAAAATKRKLEALQTSSPANLHFSNGTTAGSDSAHHHDNDNNKHRRQRNKRHRAQAPPPTPSECYFCLSNPSCETHMIGAIGTHSYVTVAKGPLSDQRTFPALGGLPCHMLIIPVAHAATLAGMPAGDEPAATQAEMARFRDALQTLVAAKSSGGADGRAALGAVTWAISRAGGVHLHWQFLPVPADLISRGLVEAAMEVEAENQGFGRLVKGADAAAAAGADNNDNSGSGDVFTATLWTEAAGARELALPLAGVPRFDLQFGRRVLAKLLGVDARAHWRDCAQTQAEEGADANAFKEAFKEYDFALAE